MSLKALVERGLLLSGVAALSRGRLGGRTLILAYHNILPAGVEPAGDRSLHLPVARFAAQLEVLAGVADVVPLAGLAAPGHHRRPRVAITFDDAYLGAVTAGFDTLDRRGLPATLFVCPGLLDGTTFWWDALAGAGDLAPAHRSHALETLQGRQERVLGWARDSGLPVATMPAACRSADEATVLALAARPGVVLGAHTWSHPSLPRLEAAQLREELERPLAWLRSRVTAPVTVISYPYGHASSEVHAAAAAAGYDGGLLVEGGWGTPADPPFAVPRFNVPAGLSLDGFRLRLAGLLCR